MATMTAIPSRLLLQPMRDQMALAQRSLDNARAEASTGRHTNMVLVLGSRTSSDIDVRIQLAGMEKDIASVKQTEVKAGIVQTALSQLSDVINSFRSTLMGARNSTNGPSIARVAAAAALASMQETLNTAFDGQYLFGGLNFSTAPINDYEDGPRSAITSAFAAEFGFLPEDPSSSSLTPSQINNFLEGNFGSLFDGTAWTGEWSNASHDTLKIRFGSEEIDVATSTNAAFARKMAASFSMIEVLASSKIGKASLEAAIDRSIALASEAQVAIGDEQAQIGAGEMRLAGISTKLTATKTQLTSHIQALEGVDSYEAATRINALMTALEASYALTARISKMSLLSYL